MTRKSAIRIGLIIGTTLGSYIPVLWGDGFLSLSSVLFSAMGGILGVYVGYKIGY